jgi:hypothetical protein
MFDDFNKFVGKYQMVWLLTSTDLWGNRRRRVLQFQQICEETVDIMSVNCNKLMDKH